MRLKLLRCPCKIIVISVCLWDVTGAASAEGTETHAASSSISSDPSVNCWDATYGSSWNIPAIENESAGFLTCLADYFNDFGFNFLRAGIVVFTAYALAVWLPTLIHELCKQMITEKDKQIIRMDRQQWRTSLKVPPDLMKDEDNVILYNAYYCDTTGPWDARDWLDSVKAYKTACEIINTFDKESSKEGTPAYVSKVVYEALFAHDDNYIR